jgi:hypothetical protein
VAGWSAWWPPATWLRSSRLVGIITESDVFRAIVEMSDAATAGVRITFELAEDEELVSTVAGLCTDYALRIGSLFSFHHRDAHDGRTRRLGVARLIRDAPADLVDGLWGSHHRVLAVAPCPSQPE